MCGRDASICARGASGHPGPSWHTSWRAKKTTDYDDDDDDDDDDVDDEDDYDDNDDLSLIHI